MQGSIQKRVGKRGVTYMVVIELPRDPVTGKRRQQRLRAPSKREADVLLAKTLNDLHQGTYVEATKLKVGEWLTEWFAGHPGRTSSHIRYERDIRRWLIPGLGAVPLARLRASHIQGFYQQRLSHGAAPAAIRTHAKILRLALGVAVRQRLVVRNVAQDVPVPQAPPPKVNYWTRDEMTEFLRRSADDPHALLYEMALKTGMRRGELLGLRWSDIDFERRWLSVQRTQTRTEKGYTLGDVKTRSGRRRIQLSTAVVEKLQAHRQELPRRLAAGPAGDDHDLVFATWRGTLLDPNFIDRVFQRLLRQLGLRRIRFHDLRHTFATLALADGAKVKAVSAQLGHASIAVTMDRYAHVIEDISIDLADRMEALAR